MKRLYLVLFAAACGGGGGKATTVEEPTHHRDPVDHSEQSEPDDGVEVQSTRGRIDPGDVESALGPHTQAIQDCYLDAVGTRKWLGGHVELHWEVAGDGSLTATQLTVSDLGAWPIEQCMLGEARNVAFPVPHGEKPADVTVPLDFAAPRPAAAWDEDMSANVVSKHVAELAKCAVKAVPDPTDVTVTLYLGTRGKVQSVGFASPAVIDDAWAACAEKKVLAWQLSDPKGQVVKVAFVYRQGETPVADDDEDEGL